MRVLAESAVAVVVASVVVPRTLNRFRTVPFVVEAFVAVNSEIVVVAKVEVPVTPSAPPTV